MKMKASCIILLVLTIGCSSPKVHRDVSDPAPQATVAPQLPRIHRGISATYYDRNGDWIVDMECSGDSGTDGYRRTKVDDDFDGYYDRVYSAGGIAGREEDAEVIHELVPTYIWSLERRLH